jgi:hypothetical protein
VEDFMRKLSLCLLGLLLLAAVAIAPGCIDLTGLTPPPEPASVKGTVASKKTGKPIPGIEVIDSGGGIDTTDQNGRYSISNIPFGETITITANQDMAKGYDKESKRTSLGRGEAREGVDFALLDIEPPKIALTKRLADPIPAGAGTEDDRTVLATIRDNEDVGGAVLRYKASEGNGYAEISMTSVSEGRYKAVIPKDVLTTVGKFYYYVHAEDTSGNESNEPGEESPLSTSVRDDKPPLITYFPPVIVAPLNTPATIAPTVTDNVRVAEVNLFYQASGETGYKRVNMVRATPNDTYYGVIPAEAVVEAGVKYYIRATDGPNETFWPEGGGPNKPEAISLDRLKSITVAPIQASVTSGNTFQFKATPIDDNGTPVSIAPDWSVEPKEMGTIDSSGLFTALKAGTGSILAALGDVSKSVSVTVTPGPLASVTVAPATAALTSGSTYQFSVVGKDANGNAISSITPTWSAIGGIGTVSSSGLFTATTVGSGMVMAASGSASGTANVTVTPSRPLITSLTANPSAISPGATSVITAAVTDPDGDAITYSWSAEYGVIVSSSGSSAVYQAPPASPPSALPPGGMAVVTLTARDTLSLSSTSSVSIRIKNPDLVAVAGLTVGSPTVNSLMLSWSGVSGATSYNVYRSTSDTGAYSPIASGITATSYTNTGLSSNTYYYYKVSAVNASGEGPQSDSSFGTTLPCLPGQVASLTVVSPTVSSLTLTWSAVSGATSYIVYRSTDNTTYILERGMEHG